MATFTEWLWSLNESQAEPFAELLAFSKEYERSWPRSATAQKDFQGFIAQTLADEPERAQTLTAELQTAWGQWQRARRGEFLQRLRPNVKMSGDWVRSRLAPLVPRLTPIAAVIVGLIVILVVGNALLGGMGAIFSRISDVGTAAGVITFLFALGTIGVMLMLAAFAVFGAASGTEGYDQRAQRFQQGKEILTLLIGLLGAIIGFYFGASGAQVAAQAPFFVSEPVVVEQASAPGERVVLITRTHGGTPPFSYSVSFEQGLGIGDVRDRVSGDGLIVEQVDVPKNAESGMLYRFTVTVTDALEATDIKSGRIEVQ